MPVIYADGIRKMGEDDTFIIAGVAKGIYLWDLFNVVSDKAAPNTDTAGSTRGQVYHDES